MVDSYSKDGTVKIAKRFGAKIIQTRGGLLWARYIGHLYAGGEIELLLDSDQILNSTTVKRGVEMMMNGYDMLILEERSYKPCTIMQWLVYFDRKHVHKLIDLHPIHGVLLARMYKYDILDKAFRNIRRKLPPQVMYKLVSQDHAVIYYESWKHASKVGVLQDAIYHIEPSSLKSLVRKFYRYGKTELNLSKYYPELAKGKKVPRKPRLSMEYGASMLLWSLKAIPYLIGRLNQHA